MTDKPESQKQKVEKMIQELESKANVISGYINNISEIKERLDKHQSIIKELNEVIHLEREIKTYPHNANGSVVLYNKLNEHYDNFSEAHFNKIARFVSLIEIEEENYRSNYLLLTQKYPTPHAARQHQEALLSSIKLLNRFYSLLDILITECNGDKVKYSQVFNFLEDQGFFMTRLEKESIELLHQININLDNVFQGIIHLIESQKETQAILENIASEISSGLGEVTASLYGVEQNLWSIYMDKE